VDVKDGLMAKDIEVAPMWEIALLILVYIIPVGFYYYSSMTNKGHWFSRSGSLMIILGASLEFRNFGVQQYLRKKQDETWKPHPEIVTKLKSRFLFDILILLSLISGTTIRGYGDLLF